MRASIIRLRFTLGFCFFLLISGIKGFPSRLNGKNEVKNWLKIRSIESSNDRTLFAGEDNSCEDFSNLGAFIVTVLQESFSTQIGRCSFKTMQIPTSLVAELGRAKMSNGKINQSYVTPNSPTSSELRDTSSTSNEFSRSLLILIPEKIGQLSSNLISQSQSSRFLHTCHVLNTTIRDKFMTKSILSDGLSVTGKKKSAYVRSANASILLKIVDTAVFFSTANASLVLSITNDKTPTGLVVCLKNNTGTHKISDLSIKLENLAILIEVVVNLKGLNLFTGSEVVNSFLTAYHSSLFKTKGTNFSPENTCRLSNSSIVELLNAQSSCILCQKIKKAINMGQTQEINENNSFLISGILFSFVSKVMNYSLILSLKSENHSTATEDLSLRIKPIIRSIFTLKTREALNQTSNTALVTSIFGKSCISQQLCVNFALISQNLSPSSTSKSATVKSYNEFIDIGELLAASGKIDEAFFSFFLSLGSILLDIATDLKISPLRTMVSGICSKYSAVNLTELNLTSFFEPTANVDHSKLKNTHGSFKDLNKTNPINSTYLPYFIESKENCSSRTLFWSSASFNSTQNIFSNSDFMIYNSGICTNTLESHTATHTSVSKKDSISIMRP
ncbi:hypothetical protein GcM3_011015 [Golovinomyces cichoracearum]|uniref:Uncharacterized protein n=1 Tax=Golovinomyces cichoracearum TaxID=62708 RepID=A0A420JA06_9PEZI|nr:hypothetical protein GcM3_011015 [Golovinomyces cichoracearum]